jgi:uncharacterized C2H2 Zn-finger protein
LSKTNTGSNRSENSRQAPATFGMWDIDIPDPKPLEKNKFQCPVCDKIYNSKEDYISHALVHHQKGSETVTEKKQALTRNRNLQELSAVQFEKGFHFYTELDQYTGVSATSLSEFQEKISTVPSKSVTFHFQRQDYQKWFRDVFGDDELAKRIDNLKEATVSSERSAEDLRKNLSTAVQNRTSELAKAQAS